MRKKAAKCPTDRKAEGDHALEDSVVKLVIRLSLHPPVKVLFFGS